MTQLAAKPSADRQSSPGLTPPPDAATIITAPLRFQLTADLNARPSDVFDFLAHHEGMSEWVPTLSKVTIDHAQSTTPGSNDTGSIRQCAVPGFGTTREQMTWWDAPRGYAYQVVSKNVPIRNHRGLFLLDETTEGTTSFVWQQYFNWKGVAARHVMARFMPFVMNGAAKNLAEKFGGSANKAARIA